MSEKEGCSNCRNQMTGWDGGFFGLPLTCECRIYSETENRKGCLMFEKKITRNDLLLRIKELEKENKQLKEEIESLKQKEEVLNKIWREYLKVQGVR